MPKKNVEPKTELLKVDEVPDVISLRRCQLIVIDGPDKGKKILLNKSVIKIGKSDASNFMLTDKTISRKHLEIRYKDDSFLLKDVGSTNGTFLNGNRVKEAYLNPGDAIKLGNSILEFISYDEKVKVEPSSKTVLQSLSEKQKDEADLYNS